MRPKAFQDLFALAAESSLRRDSAGPNFVFDCSEVGLILEPVEGNAGYFATPTNSDTFANTGGDGVHFSFLVQPDLSPDDYPVVMTVPMSDRWNHVVGENFREFLCLGCRFGYFALEQLAYDRDKTIAKIQSGVYACGFKTNPSPLNLLATLRTRFELEPWADVRSRLDQLQSKWRGAIVLSQEGREYAGAWDRNVLPTPNDP